MREVTVFILALWLLSLTREVVGKYDLVELKHKCLFQAISLNGVDARSADEISRRSHQIELHAIFFSIILRNPKDIIITAYVNLK